MPRSKHLVSQYKRPSLFIIVILTLTVLYILWVLSRHNEIVSTVLKIVPNKNIISTIDKISIISPQKDIIKSINPSKSTPNISLKKEDSIQNPVNIEAPNDRLTKKRNRKKVLNSHTNTIIHGHEMKSQNSSIIHEGKIYGSHLKDDSQELILGKK